jgi:murein endopeptidase
MRVSPGVVALAVLAVLAAPAVAQACTSRAVGLPNHGRLVCGVQLPADDPALVSWDGVLQRTPNRGWRRWGTQKLIDTIELLALDYGTRYPIGPRLVVGDLSRTHGGPFGTKYGGVGHDSHQNGLDVDIYFPRKDGLEMPPEKPSLVDRARAQWLVDRAARSADTHFLFIGPHVGLRRPSRAVQYLPRYHDNHMHLRIWP